MHEHDSRHFPIREHMAFQQATWIVQRLAWVMVAMVPILALSGIFSNGILSDQTLQQPPLTIEYERFQRVTALTRFLARVSEGSGEETQLRLSTTFQQNYEIDGIVPRPSRSTASAAGLDLMFERPETGPLTVVIWARPQTFGIVELAAAADRRDAVPFSVVIYP